MIDMESIPANNNRWKVFRRQFERGTPQFCAITELGLNLGTEAEPPARKNLEDVLINSLLT